MLIFVLPADILPGDILVDSYRKVVRILSDSPVTGNPRAVVASPLDLGYPATMEWCSPTVPVQVRRGEWEHDL